MDFLRFIPIAVVCAVTISGVTEAAVWLVPEQHATIQDAIDASSAYDTISLAPGTYSQDGIASLPVSIMSRRPIPATIISGWISIDAGSDVSNSCHVEGLVFDRTDGEQLRCVNGRFEVRRNLFDSTFTLGPAIVYFPDNVTGIFEHNIMRFNAWGLVAYGTTSLLVRNNVFRDAAGSGVTTLANNACTFKYNCYYNNARDMFGDVLDEGNIFVDPAIDGITHIPLPGSPCIDAGDPASPPDFDGSRADIGALALDRGSVDSILVEHALASPGDTVVVRVALINGAATAGITIPLHFTGVGISLVQVRHIDRGLVIDLQTNLIDNLAQTVLLGYVALDSILDPGEGYLAELVFAIASDAPEQIVVIDSTTLPPSNQLTIVDIDAMPVVPSFSPGSITVLECIVELTGDVQVDGSLTITDIVYLVNYVLRGGPEPLPMETAGDVQCDGSVNVADVIYLVNFIFKGGPGLCDVCDPSASL